MGAGKGPRWAARAQPLEWRDLKLVRRREGPGGLRDPSSGSAVTPEGRQEELRWAQGGAHGGVVASLKGGGRERSAVARFEGGGGKCSAASSRRRQALSGSELRATASARWPGALLTFSIF